MKKNLILILCLFITSSIFSQEAKNSGKIGIEYGIEKVFNEDEYYIYDRVYMSNYVNQKLSLLYRHQLIGGLYIEPRLFYYQFKLDADISISIATPGYQGFHYGILSYIEDKGIGSSIHIGYSVPIYKKFNIDVYITPDYRYSIKCKNGDVDFIGDNKWYDHPIYKRSYFQAKAGVGLNYGNISLNIDYGKYLTDRLLINKDAAMPKVLSFALGYKFK